MNREMLMLVEAISREKNVERDVVFGAVEAALAWAQPGDLLVLPVHGLEARSEVLARLAARGATSAS